MVQEEAAPARAKPLPEDPLIGRTLNGRFRLIERIGVGGMGRVYKAVQEPLDRLVAVKVLSPTYSTGKDPDFKRRFSLEASLTSKLRHPNTVTVIDYGQTGDDVYYIAMEYLEGHTLAEVLKTQGALAWGRALDISLQICRSLREAHKAGIIHRDLKPANVMLLDQDIEQDLVKVLDFGLVKSFLPEHDTDVAVTQAGIFLGSPQYMAPEQARNMVSPRSDVYSVGVMMYHMLMGRPPFMAKDSIDMIMQHMNDAPPAFKVVRPDLEIPQEVEELVRACLQKDANKRYQSMDDLSRALRRILGGSEPSGIFSAPRSFPPTPAAGLPQATPRPQIFNIADLPTIADASGPGFAIDVISEVSGPLSGEFAFSVTRRKSSKFWRVMLFVGAMALSFLAVVALHPEGAFKADEASAPAASAPASAAGAPAAGPTVLVRVETQPAGATVWAQGRRMGKTPLAMDLPAAGAETSAELVLTLDGYHPLFLTAAGMGPEIVVSEKLQRSSGGPAIRGVTAPPNAAVAAAEKGASGALISPTGHPEATPVYEALSHPQQLEGRYPVYSREATAANAQGVVVARCTVSVGGKLEHCKLLKSVPYMDRAVLESLASRRYRPATYQGNAVPVETVLSLTLSPPKG